MQYWGGPTTYSDERGHPRLRMRHAPFVIGEAERDAWYRTHGDRGRRRWSQAGELSAADEARMLAYFDQAASHMVNAAG